MYSYIKFRFFVIEVYSCNFSGDRSGYTLDYQYSYSVAN